MENQELPGPPAAGIQRPPPIIVGLLIRPLFVEELRAGIYRADKRQLCKSMVSSVIFIGFDLFMMFLFFSLMLGPFSSPVYIGMCLWGFLYFLGQLWMFSFLFKK
jgi:hypothetical protein